MHVNLGNEEQDGTKQDFNPLQWNQSNPTHQGNREICQIVQDVRTCLIQHTKGTGKYVRLYRMSEPV